MAAFILYPLFKNKRGDSSKTTSTLFLSRGGFERNYNSPNNGRSLRRPCGGSYLFSNRLGLVIQDFPKVSA